MAAVVIVVAVFAAPPAVFDHPAVTAAAAAAEAALSTQTKPTLAYPPKVAAAGMWATCPKLNPALKTCVCRTALEPAFLLLQL